MNDNRVFIIGGGPSLGSLDMSKLEPFHTIGVNKSAFFVPNVTHFITMDYTFIRKAGLARVKAIPGSRYFVANLSIDYLKPIQGTITDTRSGFKYTEIYDVFDCIITCRREDGMGVSFRDFRCGNNSGYCALQLAIALGYAQVYLLGIDLKVEKTKTHFHSGYRQSPQEFQKRISSYTQCFVRGIREISQKMPHTKVISCSSVSPLNAVIPYQDINEVI
jgi:hypothetical protein